MSQANDFNYRKAHRNQKHILLCPCIPMTTSPIKATESGIICFHVDTDRETGWASRFPQQKPTRGACTTAYAGNLAEENGD